MKKRLIICICFVLCWGLGVLAQAAAADGPALAVISLPSWSPTATPTPTPEPTATPTPTPEPTPTPTLTPEPTPTRDPRRPMVALTFDDGPNPVKTAPLLDLLEKYGIKATFFVLGTSLTEETSPLLQRMVDLGCEIGIHGLTHGKMTRQSEAYLEKTYLEMSAMISERVEGGYTPRLMRPPGGNFNQNVRDVTKKLGLSVVMWSVDTKDWRNGRNAMLKILRTETRDGSIVLCHDKGNRTRDVMEVIIPELLEKGFDLVTVSELLSRHGGPQPGKVYYSVKP